MAGLDIVRAKKLVGSARKLFESGDITGVAGLAYQAFESASSALIGIKNGADKKSHFGRRERTKELLVDFRNRVDKLWEYRNIDFYGNISLNMEKREITMAEVEDCLVTVEGIIAEIESILKVEG